MSRYRKAPKLREPEFYCRYGDHYTWLTRFEGQDDNGGICMKCALEVHDLLRALIPIAEFTALKHSQTHDEWEANLKNLDEVSRARAGSNDPGWVYYIEQGDYIKIGYTTDVKKRMKAYGPTANLLAVHPGTKGLERETHLRFRSTLARGREWFTLSPELIEHIGDVVEQFGVPTSFIHEYRVPKSQEERVRDSMKTRPYTRIAN